MNEVAIIAGMFVATFSVRYVLFAVAGRVRFPQWLSTALSFVPVAVLTAIIVPAVSMPLGEIWISINNPWLLAALITLITALIKKDLLISIMVGMASFLLLKWLLMP